MLLDLTKDSTQKELDLADLDHKERVKEIETKFKDETDLKVRLLKQEDEYYQNTRADITREGNQKQLSEKEQLEISTLEIMSFYGAKTEEAEEQKQLAIFEKEKKSIEEDAKSKIEQLKQDGAKRGDVLEKQKELEQAITDAANEIGRASCRERV